MLWVLGLFLHVAGIFLLLNAEFLAVVQVIVYAGAILVFYLFLVMLLDLPDEEVRPRFGSQWPFAAAVGLSFAALGWIARLENDLPAAGRQALAESPSQRNLSEVGRALFGPYTLPFELTSLVLLAAIIGAVVLTRRRASGS
jgi:NADH-quinone oxidoreductase subunit J